MRNINDHQVRAFYLTQAVLKGLELEGTTIDDLAKSYDGADNVISILMDYGTVMAQVIDNVESGLNDHSDDVNLAICDNVAPAWLAEGMADSNLKELETKTNWRHYVTNLTRHYYAGKMAEFMTLGREGQMSDNLVVKPKRPTSYSAEAIAYQLARVNGFAKYDEHWHWWVKVSSDFNAEFGWVRSTLTDARFADKLVPIKDLIKRPIGSNQEEREIMEEHYDEPDQPYVAPEIKGDKLVKGHQVSHFQVNGTNIEINWEDRKVIFDV